MSSSVEQLLVDAVSACSKSCAEAIHHSTCTGWTVFGLLCIGVMIGSLLTVLLQVGAKFYIAHHHPAQAAGGPPPAHHHHGSVPLQGMGHNAPPAGRWT